jgi:hypothetical protein
MKNFPWKKVFVILALGLAAYIVYSIYKAFVAGERTISGLISAPFKLGSLALSAIENLFSFSTGTGGPSTPAEALAAAGITPSDPLYNTVLTETTDSFFNLGPTTLSTPVNPNAAADAGIEVQPGSLLDYLGFGGSN